MDPNTPVAAPPPGVIPNYIDPPSRGWETILVVTICLTLMVPIFLLRVYSRMTVTRSLGWDDYLCGVGAVGTILYSGFFTTTLNYGAQVHVWNVTVGTLKGGIKYLFVYTALYGPTMFFIKASILVLYLRIFSPLWRVRLLIYLGIAIILLTNAIISILFAALLASRNGQPYIVQYNAPQFVENAENLTLASAIINFISDLYLLWLPMPLVWNLQLTRKRKLGIIAIFLTGILACISSLVSIVIRALWGHDPDNTWWSPRLVFTSIIEMNIGIICASLPACAAVFRRSSSYPSKTRTWFTKSTTQSLSKQAMLKRQSPSSNYSAQGDSYPYQGHYLEPEEVHAVTHSHSKLQPQIVDV